MLCESSVADPQLGSMGVGDNYQSSNMLSLCCVQNMQFSVPLQSQIIAQVSLHQEMCCFKYLTKCTPLHAVLRKTLVLFSSNGGGAQKPIQVMLNVIRTLHYYPMHSL